MKLATTVLLIGCLGVASIGALPAARPAFQSRNVNPEASETNQVADNQQPLSRSLTENTDRSQQQQQQQQQAHQAESQNNEVRVQFADDTVTSNDNAAENEAESELAPLDDIETQDDDSRNKRFLGFGSSNGNGGGSGMGSGNFLFDIIRLVAGSGSGSSSSSDPASGAPTPGPQTEAVPGPVTRLFVIANRGISNLVQDLILRLAATSERIVNFKARLITSII